MKSVQMLGDKQLEVREAPEPEPRDESVVVKIMASTICGTEYLAYRGESASNPRRMNRGHEAAGIVWKTPPGSTLKEGDRVTLYAQGAVECGRCVHCLAGNPILCTDNAPEPVDFMGTHAQYVLRHQTKCLPLPDTVSFEVGAIITDAVGTPYRAVKRLGVSGRDTVLITGMGPIGSAAAMICQFLGARVIAVEIREDRRAHAKQRGVDHVIDPSSADALAAVRELTDGLGPDVAIDCTGIAEPQVLCLDAVATQGRVGLVGLKWTNTDVDGELTKLRPTVTPLRVADHVLTKEITIVGSWYLSPADYLGVLDLVERRLPVESMITHRFGIDDAAEAFAKSFDGGGTKVIINPWG